MKLSTVEEAIAADIDEPVLAIRGTVTKLYKQMSGEGQYGPWTLQTGVLQDKTGEIKFVLSNAPDMPGKYRNQLVEFRCTKGSKGGWTGVKRSVDKKDKKDNLTLSDKAEIILMADELQPEPPNGETKQAPPAAANSHAGAAGSPQGASEAPSKGMTAPREEKRQLTMAELMAEGQGEMAQLANFQYAAFVMIREYLMPLLKKRGIEPDAVQEGTLVQNMLIQGYRQNAHRFFPKKQFPAKKQQSEPEPSAADLDQTGPEQPW